MYAKYVECAQRFKFDIPHNNPLVPLTIFVYSTDTSDEVHPTDEKLYYPLRGQERRDVQEKLASTMPRNFELDVIHGTDVDLALVGNMQELRPLHVYQKARSEINCKYDLTLQSLDLQDLMQLRANESTHRDPFLRHASDLNATMYSEDTIRAVGSKRIVRDDATGNCCRAPPGMNHKRVLLYAFAVFVCGFVVPVLQFITSEHNVLEISIALKRFRYQTNIHDYLRKTGNCVLFDKAFPEEWTILYNCAVHFLKRVSDKIDDMDKSFAGKDFVMDCMAFMVQSKNVKELDAIFERMMTVLLAPFEKETSNVRNQLYEMRLKGFKKLVSEEDENEPKNKVKEEWETSERNENVIYRNSPFYRRYLERLNNLKSQLIPSEEHVATNIFQSLEIAEYIVDHYMPYATIWTSIIISKRQPEISRLHMRMWKRIFTLQRM